MGIKVIEDMYDKYVEIWTDGAAKGNPGPGGYGVVLLYKDTNGKIHRKELGNAYKETTNNKMEVLAAIVALQELKEPCNVSITSDSKYLVNAFNEHWVDTWQKENFRIGKKDEVKNIDLWKKLIELVNKHKVTFNWVKGHNDNVENERCDELANIAIKKMLDNSHIKIILASASPRRKEILENAGYDVEVHTSDKTELNIVGRVYTEDLVNECAKLKAKNVYEDIYPKDILVASDTVVVNDGVIIGKPRDRDDAIKILKSLSGKMHFVATSVCIIKDGVYKIGQEITKVHFRNYDDEEIISYIDKFKPFDKAGSYGIQDDGFSFVKNIEGNLDNVIGFPLKTFERLINDKSI